MNYVLNILIMIGIYTILSLSLNLLLGYGGLLSVAQAAFYGIGAYIYSLLLLGGYSFVLCLVASVVGTSFLALLVGYPALKLRGDYFLLATIGIQGIVFDVLNNISLTRGPYGIPGIPALPTLLGFQSQPMFVDFLFVLLLTGLVVLFSRALYSSPYGRLLKSVREDETASSALGKNTARIKVWAFVVAAGIAAIAGALYASYVTYIDPTTFSLDQSIFIFAVVLVGGAGNLRGSIVGAAVLIILPEVLRFLGLPSLIAPNVRQIVYGLLLLLLMFLRPQGIAGEYKLE